MSNFHFARAIVASATIFLAFTNLTHAQTAGTGTVAQPGNGPSTGPTTRASEKADLKNLENHGYRPTATESNYPNDIQKAEKATYGSGATGADGATPAAAGTNAKTPASSSN